MPGSAVGVTVGVAVGLGVIVGRRVAVASGVRVGVTVAVDEGPGGGESVGVRVAGGVAAQDVRQPAINRRVSAERRSIKPLSHGAQRHSTGGQWHEGRRVPPAERR